MKTTENSLVDPDEQVRAARIERFHAAAANARRRLVPGDRIRVTRCPGTKRWVTFAGWDGDWIVSKSGISDIAACNIDRINGEPVDFHQQPDASDHAKR